MRLFIDTLLALTLIVVLGGIVWYQRQQQSWLENVTAVQDAMRAIESTALYHGALGEIETTDLGYARQIDPSWFDARPINRFFTDEARPWIDLVDQSDRGRFDPEQIISEGSLAAFWYNPWRGLIRARVPAQLSQRDTLELYNLVNGTSLRIEDVDWSDPPVHERTDPKQRDRVELAAPKRPKDTSDPTAPATSLMQGAIRRGD